MIRLIVRRLLLMIPVLLGVSFLVFSIMSLTPGDPVEIMLGDNYTEESYQEMTQELGLDKPFIVRYINYVINAVQGDFGISYRSRLPVLMEIQARFMNTFMLAFASIVFAVGLGIPLGTISAVKQYSAIDSVSLLGSLILVSMPNFWLGIMLILLFSAKLGWFPSSGFREWKSLFLPAVTLGAISLAFIARMTRSSMLETIRQDYIRTARAKGLKEWTVIIRHALRNAMIPVITTIGLQFGYAIGGTVMVEMVFSWPGIGSLLVECIKLRDTPMVMASVLLMAVMFSVLNLAVDIIYAFLDPRIRVQYQQKKSKKGGVA